MEMQNYINSKILTDKLEIGRQVAVWNFLNKKIVFTNGCFDILHAGHIEYLAKAAGFGDILAIGLNTDNSVKNIKGENRPVNDESSRAKVLAAIGFVDAVMLFDEDTPYALIKIIQPDVLVKGSDYSLNEIVGRDIVENKNGVVKTIDLLDGYSTSGMIMKIKNTF